MLKRHQLVLVMPAYNEQDNIAQVVLEWLKATKAITDSKLLVIDDGSQDETPNILSKLEKKYVDRLMVIRKANSGHGNTCLFGYAMAINELNAAWVFQTDSDGQTDPNDFQKFWRLRSRYPFIFGHRIHRKDGWGRIFVTQMLRLSLFGITGNWIKDANVPFRLMQANTLRSILKDLPKDFYLANILLAIEIAKSYPIHWSPVYFGPRTGGKSSYSFVSLIAKGLEFCLAIIKLQKSKGRIFSLNNKKIHSYHPNR